MADVFALLFETLVASECVVEGLFLPQRALASQESIHAPGGDALDLFHNRGQRVGPAVFVKQRGEQEMHVIGHDDSGFEVDAPAVVIEAMGQDEIARGTGQGIAVDFAEGNKDDRARVLIVGHAPSVFVFARERSEHKCRADTLVRCS